MKKKYEKPIIVISMFEHGNVITDSAVDQVYHTMTGAGNTTLYIDNKTTIANMFAITF